MDQVTKWDALCVSTIEQTTLPYALIVLNRPIRLESTDFKRLWNQAAIRVLVDGGANEWFHFINENKLDDIKRPHFSTGDMDSISEESQQRLNAMNCQRIYTPDQIDTDCTKSLIAIRPYLQPAKIQHVLIMTDFGGRIDQTLSQINSLFKRPVPDDVQVYLKSHDTIGWLLSPGQHVIQIPQEYVSNEYWCGYIPMDGQCCVTTTGLKWDLTKGIVRFGQMISTSNTYKSSTVTIHCDNYLFWSMGTCSN